MSTTTESPAFMVADAFTPADPAVIAWIAAHGIDPKVVVRDTATWTPANDDSPAWFSYEAFDLDENGKPALHKCGSCDDWHYSKSRQAVEFDGPLPTAGLEEVPA